MFRHSETKETFEGKSSYPPPALLSIIFIATGNFLKRSSQVFPYENFRHSKAKILRRKILIPPLFSIEFFATGNFLKHSREGLACETFRHFETKKTSTENHDTPPCYPQSFSLQEVFLNATQKCSPTKLFGTVRQKICRRKFTITPLLSLIFFASGSFLKHNKKEFPCEKFGTVRQESFRRKILLPPPLNIHRVFRYRKLPQT